MSKALLKIQLLDITSLSSSKPRSLFSKDEIDRLADNFLKVGGNTNLILVQRLDLENFEVLEGHLEYYAAVRARELNDGFERINGVILDKKNESLIKEQYTQTRLSIQPAQNNSDATDNSQIQTAIATLEKNLLDHLQDQLQVEVSNLEKNLSKNLERKFDGVKILVPRDEDHLEVLNSEDLNVLGDKLKAAGFMGKRANNIAIAIIQERKKGRFTSFSEVTDRVRLSNNHRAITAESMVKILDAWNRFIEVNDTK